MLLDKKSQWVLDKLQYFVTELNIPKTLTEFGMEW